MSSPIIIEKECEKGDIYIIRNAKNNIKWNRKNSNNETYYDIAIKYKQYEVAKELLKKYDYESITECSKEERDEIHDISSKMMINHIISLENIKNHISKYGKIQTLYNGSNVVNELLNLYCSGSNRIYEHRDNWGNIIKLNFNNDLKIINFLIKECNANVNSILYDDTPLIRAVNKWIHSDKDVDKEIIDLLLDNGADINKYVTESIYRSPLLIAVKWGKINHVNYLISKGADPKLCKLDIDDVKVVY